jgi:hypothetical protein
MEDVKISSYLHAMNRSLLPNHGVALLSRQDVMNISPLSWQSIKNIFPLIQGVSGSNESPQCSLGVSGSKSPQLRQGVSGSNESPQCSLGVSGSKSPQLWQGVSGSNESLQSWLDVLGSKSPQLWQGVLETCVRNEYVSGTRKTPQPWQSVRNKSLSLKFIRNSCLLSRISVFCSDYHNILILESHKKGNFTSSYSQIWKCSQLCSFDKPVIHITKELYFVNIPSVFHLYSIVYFTCLMSAYNRCIRIYLLIRRYFMYQHDFKQLWKKMIVDGVPYKKIQCKQLYTAISSSDDNPKDQEKKETFQNDSSLSMSSD